MQGYGWMWELVSAADEAADTIYCICTDTHEKRVACAFCKSRSRLLRAMRMARRQIEAREREAIKRKVRRA